MAAAYATQPGEDSILTLFLCGDVMTGRGIDQVLRQSSDPQLHEPYVRDARDYVGIAEQVNGPIPRPITCSYLWGDALHELERAEADLRIINLETSVTTSSDHWPGKGVHYRMHPANAECIAAAGINVASLANNHVLDWGYPGLTETIESLRSAGIKPAGAGPDLQAASAPAIEAIATKGRVLVYAFGHPSSGVSRVWAAAHNRAGINLLPDFSGHTVRRIAEDIARIRQSNDVVVVSIHWGGNWGYEIPEEHIRFARDLVDRAGVDVVHGHSSHHAKAFEVYRGKLILYGTGDFLNDYEGIGGQEFYRSDLVLMYFPSINPDTGELRHLRIVPMQIRRFSLHRASAADAQWLLEILNREGARFDTRLSLNADATLSLG